MNDAELIETLDEAIEKLKKLVPYYIAFCNCLESFAIRLDELENESESLEQDLREGVRGYGMNRKCFEVRTKKKLLSEVVCFMSESLEEAKKGEIE